MTSAPGVVVVPEATAVMRPFDNVMVIGPVSLSEAPSAFRMSTSAGSPSTLTEVPEPTMLIVSRIAQGASAALVAPNALAILTSIFITPEERTRTLSIYTASTTAGATAGIVLGGIFVQYLGWRSVLIVDGMNNHDWERGTKLLKAILENSGLFTVDVSTTPTNKNTSPEGWAKWQPNFARYQVVVNNFNGGYRTNDTHWPREVEKSFEDYVANGGGVVQHVVDSHGEGAVVS